MRVTVRVLIIFRVRISEANEPTRVPVSQQGFQRPIS
jgi:hypothetical protein